MVEKVKHFAATLDDDERALFAVLLAPGVAQAYADTDEVTGFAATVFAPLPDALAAAVRSAGLRVVGLDDP